MSVRSRRFFFVVFSAVLVAWLGAYSQSVAAQVQRFKFSSGNSYLIVEFLDDDLAHFELSALGPGPDTGQPIFTTPQVFRTDYAGPGQLVRSPDGRTLETAETRVSVDATTLCATITDKTKGLQLTTLCPLNLSSDWKGLTIASGAMQHVYGLGEQFIEPGDPDGDWTGRVRLPGDDYGNQMVGFGGGMAGNVQIPIMYAVGPASTNYALFLDHVYKQRWDFAGSPWKVETLGDRIRWYVLTGQDLPDLRRDYMDLTGRPPVPPKKMFGLWISEYGYDDWAELEGKLAALRAKGFPIDGFVLDLQWFGGITRDSDDSNMGRVTWDLASFPNPKATLARYRDVEGLGIVVIEESYVSKGLAEHADLAGRGYLVRSGCATCEPVYLDNVSDKNNDNWWGKGGMIDWTNDQAADYWHDLKRQRLVRDGVIGHWIDLGEPEMYDADPFGGDPADWVSGVLPGKHAHADYHNLYNSEWAESIARGYRRNSVTQRPFMMARSGAAGIQRFGTSLWSADIGSNLANLAAHSNAQMHMSMAGIDYFGSDIGGFHRRALGGDDLDDMYTQWFANGMMLDVPGRPHTENLCNCRETAPDRIGHGASNLANVRERYALVPYLYSLAHRAHEAGEPVAPPLVYYYQDDMSVRKRGGEKLLGRDLLLAAVARAGVTHHDVYLPAGDWVDVYTNEWLNSTGEMIAAVPLQRDGLFRLPMYARAGAIIPRVHVDEQTMNVLGMRRDGSARDELVVRVYASAIPSQFTLYEDDGTTTAYRQGELRKTVLSQQVSGGVATIVVAPAQGTYVGAPFQRSTVLELIVEDAQGSGVSLNGANLVQHATRDAFERADTGWYNAGNNRLLAKSGVMEVGGQKTFEVRLEAPPDRVSQTFLCRNGNTVWGQSVFVVGNTPSLGSWSPTAAVKLSPSAYPTWTGTVHNLLPRTTIEWKCIKRPESAFQPVEWEPGANNVFTSPASGSGGDTIGDFAGDSMTVSQNFVCDNGETVWGQAVYVVGSVAALGGWDPSRGVKLDPSAYPRWTGTIGSLPASTSIEWKCIKRSETGDIGTADQWEPDPNNVFTSAAAGSGGDTFGHFGP